VKDAMRRAVLLTAPLGVKVGKVLNVAEASQYGGSRMYAAAAVMERNDVPVSGGTLSFSATINISWELSKE